MHVREGLPDEALSDADDLERIFGKYCKSGRAKVGKCAGNGQRAPGVGTMTQHPPAPFTQRGYQGDDAGWWQRGVSKGVGKCIRTRPSQERAVRSD
jgi:hypothetical protein